MDDPPKLKVQLCELLFPEDIQSLVQRHTRKVLSEYQEKGEIYLDDTFVVKVFEKLTGMVWVYVTDELRGEECEGSYLSFPSIEKYLLALKEAHPQWEIYAPTWSNAERALIVYYTLGSGKKFRLSYHMTPETYKALKLLVEKC